MSFSLPIAADTAIIIDDEGLTGGELVGATTGTFAGFIPLADFASASESGVVMLDGTMAVGDNRSGTGNGVVGLYTGTISLIANAVVGTPGNSFPRGITTDRVTYFYVVSATSTNALTLYKLNKSGTVLDSWNLSTTYSQNPVGCCVSRDNLFFYFNSSSGGAIKKLNLTTSAITTPATLGTTVIWMGVGADGNIYLTRRAPLSSDDWQIEKYDTSFSLLDTLSAGPAGYGSIDLGVCHFSADDLNLFAWTQKSSGGTNPNHLSALRKVQLSTLNAVNDVTNIPTETQSINITEGSEISNSCPLLITADTAAVTGTIIVTKTTMDADSTVFDFTATNMSPTTFSLSHGQSRTFTVTVGDGYGVAEEPQDGWSSSVTVSDDSPPNNINVSAGETVTVAFLNSPFDSTTYPLRRQRIFVLP